MIAHRHPDRLAQGQASASGGRSARCHGWCARTGLLRAARWSESMAGVLIGAHAAASSRRERPVWRRKTSSRLGRARVRVCGRSPAPSSTRMSCGTAISPWSTYSRTRSSSLLASRTNGWLANGLEHVLDRAVDADRDDVTGDLPLQLVGRALGHDPTVVDDGQAVGQRIGFLEVVGRQEHGRPGSRAGARISSHMRARACGSRPGRRLVEEQDRAAGGRCQGRRRAGGVMPPE